jgi:hypothetical protein
MNQTFTEFKNHFYSRNKDLTLFDCAEFNLLKVVLDGLFVDYASKSKLFIYITYPIFLIKIIHFVKRIKTKSSFIKVENQICSIKNKKIIFRGGYDILNEKKESRVFKNVCKYLDDNSYCFVNDVNVKDNKLNSDLNIVKHFNDIVYGKKLNRQEIIFLESLQNSFMKIKKHGNFTKLELENISFAIQKFFLDYLKWSRVLVESETKYFIFRCHYHFEGMLLALKRNGIKTIELQHGLIAEEDIFYVMPKQVAEIADRALFADEIWVYGESWKNTLLKGGEYAEHKIKMFGYYMENEIVMNESLQKILSIKGNRKIILVTTQTGLHKEFIEYLTWLKSDMIDKNMWTDYIIVIKPHPNEPKGIYSELLENDKVFFYEDNLDAIFSNTSILLSVYSTTIIEALRYEINCFSLYVERYEDYISAFVSKGFSKSVKKEENLIELNHDNLLKNKTNEIFSPLNNTLIHQLV